MNYRYNVLVIGAGSAGLTLALHLAQHGKVAVLSKTSLQEGSSYYAQGGVAAVHYEEDSLASHIEDTLNAGCGLCDKDVVEFVVNHAREAIEWLIDIGVNFTKTTTKEGKEIYHLTREGGHEHRRVWHAADATGKEVKHRLDDRVHAEKNIDVFENHLAVDLIKQHKRCVGAYILNTETSSVDVFQADVVILATGGASRVYLYTTNPDVASGDGIAIAARAGCRVKHLEFNQFHPTCLYNPKGPPFLISEVLRGEGGILRLPDGTAFMSSYDKRAELAPRDIVARAIDDQMKRRGLEFVYLDITHKGEAFIKQSFPTIYQHCLGLGVDMTKEWIPVVPAAHYTCGGVVTDLKGRTDIEGLYAIGEVAYTGLHGANRMASNSLLECLVFAREASQDIIQRLKTNTFESVDIPVWDESQVMASDEAVVITQCWDELRRVMWNYVGIVRTTKRLERAKRRIDLLKQEVHEYYAHFKVTRDLLELRNLVCVADLMVQCALARKESIGLHYNVDYF